MEPVRILTPEIKLQIRLIVLSKYANEEVSSKQIDWLCLQLETDYVNGLTIEGLN